MIFVLGIGLAQGLAYSLLSAMLSRKIDRPKFHHKLITKYVRTHLY